MTHYLIGIDAGTSVGQRSHVDLFGWVDGFPARALGGRFEGRNGRVENGVRVDPAL